MLALFICLCLLVGLFEIRGLNPKSLSRVFSFRRTSWSTSQGSMVTSTLDRPTGSSSLQAEVGDFAQSFVAQKNYILLDKLENPANGEYTEAAMQYVNFCDESFNNFLSERIANAESEEVKARLGKVRYEINSARQKKLMEADKVLRGILSSGGLKQMEAKLAFHLRRAEIDMAFMVILQLNIEDAINNKVEKAVQVMTHLGTLINEHQDKMVSPPVRLMRLLLREDDPNVRKQMLRQKLLIGANLVAAEQAAAAAAAAAQEEAEAARGLLTGEGSSSSNINAPQATASPQCEHIVVAAVQSWGGADVEVQQLRETIVDVLSQMSGIGGDQQTLAEMEFKCKTMTEELQQVVDEVDAPKVSDQCDNEDAAAAAAAAFVAPSEDDGGAVVMVSASQKAT